MKNRKRVTINWNYVEYLVRKGISTFGYVCCGIYICAMVEIVCDMWTIGGAVLGLAVGMLANLGNEYCRKSQED